MPSKEIWSQEEERLASLKICQANGELQRERRQNRDDIFRRNNTNVNYHAIISQTAKLVVDEAKKCADVVYEKFCEVWQKQGKPKTPEFLRSVILPRVSGAIDARISIGRDELERMALRLSIHDSIMKPLLSDLQRKAEYLKRDEWQKKIEIEAREIELYHQCRELEIQNSPETKPIAEYQTETYINPQIVNSPDYRSVKMRGKAFMLTPKQAQSIEFLHANWKQGTPDVGEACILEKIESTSNKLRKDIFKGNFEAFDALVKQGEKKGTYRLNLPLPGNIQA